MFIIKDFHDHMVFNNQVHHVLESLMESLRCKDIKDSIIKDIRTRVLDFMTLSS